MKRYASTPLGGRLFLQIFCAAWREAARCVQPRRFPLHAAQCFDVCLASCRRKQHLSMQTGSNESRRMTGQKKTIGHLSQQPDDGVVTHCLQ